MIQFEGWPKTPRLSAGGVTITEKIDGTNACVIILPYDGDDLSTDKCLSLGGVQFVIQFGQQERAWIVGAQSRKRLIFPGQDNAGFAGWVQSNAYALVDLLGPGRHFGEWWGQGIQRRYGMTHKVFSLFNTHKWGKVAAERSDWTDSARSINMTMVPTMYVGKFSDRVIEESLFVLRQTGSMAAAEWGQNGQRAEGIIIRHRDLGGNLKAFVENDDVPKTKQMSSVQKRALTPLDPVTVQQAKELLALDPKGDHSVWD